ncbi:pyridoxamine 5'-phosphate oxidase family protein [Urechidicola croceus]|nr:pyridoxamine 5'-phosphate oxidase family protein [Urechidicola croceus]
MENLDKNECLELLKNNYVGHLAYLSQSWPFVIPITYYFNSDDNSIISYSSEGHKIEAMRKNTAVSLEVEEITTIDNWKSVLVLGIFEEVNGIDAKYLLNQFSKGVKENLDKNKNTTPHFINEFSSKSDSMNIPIVYKLKIQEIFGKVRRP